MLTEDKDPRLRELLTRSKKHLRYELVVLFTETLFALWLLLPLVVVGSFFVLNIFESLALLCAGIFLFFVAVKLARRKLEEYPLEDDEWSRAYTYLISKHLQEYAETDPKAIGTRRECRQKALRDTIAFLSRIQEDWTIGKFLPVRLYAGESISSLKKNIEERIIPAIRYGNDDKLEAIRQIMTNFFYSSKGTFNIETINAINSQISARIESKPSEIGCLAKSTAFWKEHEIARYSIMFIMIAVSSFVVGYACWLVGFSKEGAGMLGVTLFGILTAIYFLRPSKSEK